VPSLYAVVRPQGKFERSLELLKEAHRIDPGTLTKSGLMVGLGETRDELLEVFEGLRRSEVDILTVGQYLRPTPAHLPVQRYWTPDEFAELKVAAQAMGFRHVECGPLVRSSYHAEEQAAGSGSKMRPRTFEHVSIPLTVVPAAATGNP
jgi:lipoic acid synthetase